MSDEWEVDIKGNRNSDWEISLLKKTNKHGKLSWGWCDNNIEDYSKCEKILIGCYSSCYCAGTMAPEAFDAISELAKKLLKEKLND